MSRGVCVVTGGSRGIGAAAARLAGERGWDVLVNYRADEAAANAVAGHVRRGGAKAEVIAADVGTDAGIKAVFEAADRFGTLTALINNAGVGDQVGSLDTFTFERVERMARINFTGSVMCAREAVVRMAQRFGGRGGSIVNISSAAAKLGGANQFVDYSATKGAIDTFTVGAALEWAMEGVRINAVRPGVIDTDFHDSVGASGRPQKVGPTLPMGRAGTPNEVAAAILWLMSDEASYTTGAILDVSGGRSAIP